MADRATKERKLVALMINDLGIADVEEAEVDRELPAVVDGVRE